MTVRRIDGLTWVAARDGLAHANPNDGTLRALCGAMPTSERYAWPIRESCVICSTIAAARKGDAIAKSA